MCKGEEFILEWRFGNGQKFCVVYGIISLTAFYRISVHYSEHVLHFLYIYACFIFEKLQSTVHGLIAGKKEESIRSEFSISLADFVLHIIISLNKRASMEEQM